MDPVPVMARSLSEEGRSCRRPPLRRLLRWLWLATLLAMLVTVVLCWLRGAWNWSEVLGTFLGSLIYSQLIGTPTALAFELLMPAIWPRRPLFRWGLVVLVLICGSAVGTLAATIVLYLLGSFRHTGFWPSYSRGFRISLVVAFTMGIGIVVYESLKARLEVTTLALKTRELEHERILKQVTEARLASLESRLHPHFLFNALNSISALIPVDPERAERLVEQMAALLRFSLDSHQRGLVPLAQELRIVKDYLEIERVRFADRLRFHLDVPAQFEEAPVPPLSLQTLVENSVKYAVSPRLEGATVRITACLEAGSLRLACEDDGPGFDAAVLPPGHGLHGLEQRLETLFNGAARLEIARQAGWTSVAIVLPGRATL